MTRKALTYVRAGPDWNAHQRGGWVALWLWQGSRLSDTDIARLCGMTRQGAAKMMDAIEAAFPVIKVDGKWEWMNKNKDYAE